MDDTAGNLVVAVREGIRLDDDAISNDSLDRESTAIDLGAHSFDDHSALRIKRIDLPVQARLLLMAIGSAASRAFTSRFVSCRHRCGQKADREMPQNLADF
jgi:hypothetical protein